MPPDQGSASGSGGSRPGGSGRGSSAAARGSPDMRAWLISVVAPVELLSSRPLRRRDAFTSAAASMISRSPARSIWAALASRSCRVTPRKCRAWPTGPGGDTGAAGLGLPLGAGSAPPLCAPLRARPGELVHVDIKELGNIPDGDGWRSAGRAQGARNARATTPQRRLAACCWRSPGAACWASTEPYLGTACSEIAAIHALTYVGRPRVAASVLCAEGGCSRRSRARTG